MSRVGDYDMNRWAGAPPDYLLRKENTLLRNSCAPPQFCPPTKSANRRRRPTWNMIIHVARIKEDPYSQHELATLYTSISAYVAANIATQRRG